MKKNHKEKPIKGHFGIHEAPNLKPGNPLSDISAALSYHKANAYNTKFIQLTKEILDLMLKETGCKDMDELYAEYKRRYPYTTDFKFQILE